MRYEDPVSLLGRLRLGREEFCQRLLTMLVLGGDYPRWNSRSIPTPRGMKFLRELDELSFGDSLWQPAVAFVDELDLPSGSDTERGGAPDYGVLWPDRTWLVELKTERGSHRPQQIPSYFRLATKHFPDTTVDLTYLTPRMVAAHPEVSVGDRYEHLFWDDVVPLISDSWSTSGDPAEQRVCRVLLLTLAQLDTPPAVWRRALFDGMATTAVDPGGTTGEVPSPEGPETAPGEGGLARDTAAQTAADGVQRALDLEVHSLGVLHDLRKDVRDDICPDGRWRAGRVRAAFARYSRPVC